MKRKLKTWEQFKEEFKPSSDVWDEYGDDGWIVIKYNDMEWTITLKMKEFFGSEIKVYETEDFNYTYIGYGFFWNELWFEQEFVEFLSKEEVEI